MTRYIECKEIKTKPAYVNYKIGQLKTYCGGLEPPQTQNKYVVNLCQ